MVGGCTTKSNEWGTFGEYDQALGNKYKHRPVWFLAVIRILGFYFLLLAGRLINDGFYRYINRPIGLSKVRISSSSEPLHDKNIYVS